MRHRKSGLKIGRTASHRQSMFKNMVTSLFKHDRIRTTDVKAKELRRWADHVITLAKRGDLHARRQVMAIIRDKNLVHQLFENASERYSSRSGGYTRIMKVGRRAGDAAPISLIELIDHGSAKEGGPAAKKKQAPAQAPAPTAEPSTATSAPPSGEQLKNATEETQAAAAPEKSETTSAVSDSEPKEIPDGDKDDQSSHESKDDKKSE